MYNEVNYWDNKYYRKKNRDGKGKKRLRVFIKKTLQNRDNVDTETRNIFFHSSWFGEYFERTETIASLVIPFVIFFRVYISNARKGTLYIK